MPEKDVTYEMLRTYGLLRPGPENPPAPEIVPALQELADMFAYAANYGEAIC